MRCRGGSVPGLEGRACSGREREAKCSGVLRGLGAAGRGRNGGCGRASAGARAGRLRPCGGAGPGGERAGGERGGGGGGRQAGGCELGGAARLWVGARPQPRAPACRRRGRPRAACAACPASASPMPQMPWSSRRGACGGRSARAGAVGPRMYVCARQGARHGDMRAPPPHGPFAPAVHVWINRIDYSSPVDRERTDHAGAGSEHRCFYSRGNADQRSRNSRRWCRLVSTPGTERDPARPPTVRACARSCVTSLRAPAGPEQPGPMPATMARAAARQGAHMATALCAEPLAVAGV